MTFTALTIKQLPKRDKRYLKYEEGGKGFAVRVTPNGTITFVFVYRYEKKLNYFTLGRSEQITLKEARKRANAARRKLEQGINPAVAKQIEKLKNLADPTIEELADEYIEKWAKPRKRSWTEDQRILNHDILPRWRQRKASSILRREIILLLESIVDRGAPIAANRTLALIRRLFNFAIERDILEHSPCSKIKALGKENRKDRVLNLDEIKLFWTQLPSAPMTEALKILLKLMLVTAQRKGELVKAKWTDFDLQQRWWIIPSENTKNGNTHRIYLSDIGIELLAKLKELNPDSQWLFPSPKANKPITPESIARGLSRSKETFSKIEPFTAHDLRRTAASHMTSIGISRLIVSKILNHADSSVTAIYDRHSYDSEKKHALNAWASKLNQIILSGISINKIIQFQQAG